MDFNRLRQGELVAACAAILLFIFMFISWFEISDFTVTVNGQEFSSEDAGAGFADLGAVDNSASAWQSFGFIDILLLAAILVALGAAAVRASDANLNLPVSMAAIVAAVGVLAVALIVFRLIVTPDLGTDEIEDAAQIGATDVEADVNVGREIGAFLGLLAALGIAAGGLLAMREEGTTFGGEVDRLQSRTGGPAPGGAPPAAGPGDRTQAGTPPPAPPQQAPPPEQGRGPGGPPPASGP